MDARVGNEAFLWFLCIPLLNTGVAGGWVFVIIGALFFIKQGVKLLIRINKTEESLRKGYPISDVTSAWFPARVDFSVYDIEATVHMGDGRVSIECSYRNKTLRRQKLSADDIGAKLIFESILDTSE